MPVHDWTKVSPGIFHHFHATWVPEIARTLNSGDLPPGYYALAEQVTSGAAPDGIALEFAPDSPPRGEPGRPQEARRPHGQVGHLTATVPPPRTSMVSRTQPTYERAFEAVPGFWRQRIVQETRPS